MSCGRVLRALAAWLAARSFGVVALSLGVAAQASAPRVVEYLYVEANEGGSSGGHVGLRIGDDVFHYQQRDGLLRLLRDDVREFLHAYALAGNRNVHALRLDLSAETAARVLTRFEARQRAERRQLERRALLRADRRLLELASGDALPARLAPGARAAIDVPAGSFAGAMIDVPAAGYFARAFPAPPPEAPDPALVALRARLAAQRRGDDVEARIATLRAQRRALAPFVLRPVALPDVESEPAPADAWSARHADLAGAQTALELLRDATPLRADALLPAAGEPLSPQERAALCALREPQALDLVELAQGARPDWGAAFLLGAARLLALEASCRRGELLVLDAYPDASGPDESLPAPRPLALALLVRDAERALLRARERMQGPGSRERRLSDLEVAANQRAELLRTLRDGERIRVPEERLVPRRGAPRLDFPAAAVSRGRLLRLLEGARARESEFERELEALHAYHLVSRNCVTEVFRTLHAAHADDRAAIEAGLGGFVDPDSLEGFVPFAAARAVRSRYRVASERTIPSLRAARVAALVEREGWWASLRERSPWTARSYRFAATDSRFVFFSDSAPALRPLFGVVNLAAGVGEALLGLARAPFDEGAQLASGLRGVFWSLPELAFFSVRKGSNEYVPVEFVAALETEPGGADQAASTTTAIVASVSGAPTRQ